MLAAASLSVLLSQAQAATLGYVTAVRGEVSVTQAKQARSAALPKGALKRKWELRPGDRIQLGKGSALDGVYDGKRLLLYADRTWLAPEPGKFLGPTAPRTLLGLREMGGDEVERKAPFLFPYAGAPVAYVDSLGVLGFVWRAPQGAERARVTITAPDGQSVTEDAPARLIVGGIKDLGALSSRSAGLLLRRQAKEDESVAARIVIQFDRGDALEAEVTLPPRRLARKWDQLAADLDAALAAEERDEFLVTEKLTDLLAEAENGSSMLRAWSVFRCWQAVPESFAFRDAVRRMAEESGDLPLMRRILGTL